MPAEILDYMALSVGVGDDVYRRRACFSGTQASLLCATARRALALSLYWASPLGQSILSPICSSYCNSRRRLRIRLVCSLGRVQFVVPCSGMHVQLPSVYDGPPWCPGALCWLSLQRTLGGLVAPPGNSVMRSIITLPSCHVRTQVGLFPSLTLRVQSVKRGQDRRTRVPRYLRFVTPFFMFGWYRPQETNGGHAGSLPHAHPLITSALALSRPSPPSPCPPPGVCLARGDALSAAPGLSALLSCTLVKNPCFTVAA